tara:strand:- start:98 stop:1063 length:966 start_codon:yes stop_codon:yes gene_type:complete
MNSENFNIYGKVAVLSGGDSPEREISLMSGRGIFNALKKLGLNVHFFDPAVKSLAEFILEKFNRVFIALHGTNGEDGTIQGILEYLKIPYTGPGVLASSLAIDKVMTKKIWNYHGIATPKFYEIDENLDLNLIRNNLSFPLIVKPVYGGSTLGITKVTSSDKLYSAYELALKYGKKVMVEEYIEGIELTCPILGSSKNIHALPIVQIKAPNSNYNYHNKYFSDKTEYLCPTGLSFKIEEEIKKIVLESYTVLNCRGWSRVDLILRKTDNKPFLLEINTSPGMTLHSLVPISAQSVGMSYESLCFEILKMASLDNYYYEEAY